MQEMHNSGSESVRRCVIPSALGLILLFGAILRFTGLNWDEYQHLHPDERFMTMVETGIQLPASIGEYFDTANSPLNPYNRSFGTFVYGTYPLFLAKFVGELIRPFGVPIAGHLLSAPAPDDFGGYGTLYRILNDPGGYESIHIIGRFLAGLFDLLTVLLIFLIGRRLYGPWVGLLAAFFLAFSVFDIQQSHFFTVDTFANLPLVLSIWFALDIAEERGGWRSFVLAGAFFGLAVAARINLITFAAIIALAGVLRLIKGIEGFKLERVTIPTLNGERTFAFSSEAILESGDGQEGDPASPSTSAQSVAGEEQTSRVVNLGPFSFQLEPSAKPEVALPQDSTTRLAIVETPQALPQSPDVNPRELATVTRVFNLGPLTFELQSTRAMPTGGVLPLNLEPSVGASTLEWVTPLRATIIGLSLAVLSAFLVFRVAQPYAFQGLGLNPKWLQDINSLKDILSGAADYPPGHQWANRADYWFPLQNIVLWGLGLPLGLAAVLGFIVAGFELAVRREWRHILIFFWVGGTFLYQGQQYVKTMRYSLPLYPFLALFAAFFFYWLWNQVRQSENLKDWKSRVSSESLNGTLRPLAQAAVALLFLVTVGYTLFWAAAFTSIYTRPVSRVAASHWMIHNIPAGSAIGNEHWDDGLPLRVEGIDPFGSMFKGVTTSGDGLLDLYAEDNDGKRDLMVKWLDVTDYIVLSSNRLYGSITRLPLRFPMTTKYYESLFDGSLGFELVNTFTSYPQFLGITINDDNAEEAFTVYDHPKVLIFKKTAAYSHDKFAAMLNSFDLTTVMRQTPLNYTLSHGGYQLSPQDAVDDAAGGTWSSIFDPTDLANRIPVLVWVVLLELIGVIAFPVVFAVFRGFADRGYAFSKAIGILGLAWGSWTLASYHLLGFSRTSISIVLVVLVLLAIVSTWRQGHDIVEFVRGKFGLLLVEELVFLAFFSAFLLVRYGNPDLWHPYFGGEKPMDFAYLNAVIKTTWFPSYNPWFEGGYINYYYFGQVISATLVRFTGIIPEVAYNLLIPMFFALTALGAFGVAFNLVSAFTSRLATSTPDVQPRILRPGRAIVAGLLASIFVLVIGNLGEVGVLGDGLLKLGDPSQSRFPGIGGALTVVSWLLLWLVDRRLLPVPTGNWYWTATRVIPDTINEFPFFTFLYADLHAHLMGLAFTLVALASGLHAIAIKARFKWYDLIVIALVLGALRAINTWDYPTYLALLGGAMVIGYFSDRTDAEDPTPSGSERIKRYLIFGTVAFIQIMLVVIPTNALGIKVTLDMIAFGLLVVFGLILGWIRMSGSFDPRVLTRVLGWRFMSLVVLSVVFYFPFMENYGTSYTSAELWKDQRTTLPDYLVVHGIFLFMIATYLIVQTLRKRIHTSVPSESSDGPHASRLSEYIVYALPGLAVFELVLIVLNLMVFAVIFPLILLALWLLLRSDTGPEGRFIALLIVAALVMTLVVEVVTLVGDIGRMNTVFKFYLQGWVLFAIASASGLALIADRMLPQSNKMSTVGDQDVPEISFANPIKQFWWVALSFLLLAGLLYPIMATWAKVNDRFVAGSPPGLNGLDYMLTATYNVQNQDLALSQDYDAIQWIRENIKGSPVIAEASYELYRWNDRVSINTGLPTIVGWDWHTKQQYSLLDGAIIDQRKQDIANLYNDADPTTALQLIRRYNVSFVYVGPLERVLYDPAGLSKFEAMSNTGTLSKVYDSNGVQIYKVNAIANALLH